jgi:hypothetical protein
LLVEFGFFCFVFGGTGIWTHSLQSRYFTAWTISPDLGLLFWDRSAYVPQALLLDPHPQLVFGFIFICWLSLGFFVLSCFGFGGTGVWTQGLQSRYFTALTTLPVLGLFFWDRVYLCSSSYPQICCPPALALEVLGLQMCATKPGCTPCCEGVSVRGKPILPFPGQVCLLWISPATCYACCVQGLHTLLFSKRNNPNCSSFSLVISFPRLSLEHWLWASVKRN